MGLTRFDIHLGTLGSGHVVVDGVDITNRLRRVSIDSAAGEVPKIFLEMLGEGHLEGEGIVHVVRAPEPLDQREAVAEFLSNIDAGALEAAALEQMDGFGSGLSTGEAFLAVLRGYVRVDDDGT